MSGFLDEVATPCPQKTRGMATGDQSHDRSSSFNSLWNDSIGSYDDTRNIDFTTEIRAPILTGVKPRRRTKTTSSFAIHDDNNEKSGIAMAKQKSETQMVVRTSNRKMSLLAQPAQRFRPQVSFAPSPPKYSPQKRETTHKRQALKPNTERNNELLMKIIGDENEIRPNDGLKKEIRRNTVYIPPDDNTVASVFMGLFSPLKSENPNYVVSEDTDIKSIESQLLLKRQAKQRLVSSPHRAPLQPSVKVIQESCVRVDVVGKNGGKENIPPGMDLINSNDKDFQPAKFKKTFSHSLGDSKLAANSSRAMLACPNAANKPLAAKSGNRPGPKIIDIDQPKLKTSVMRDRRIEGMRRTLKNTKTNAQSSRSSVMSNPLRYSRNRLDASISKKSMKHLNAEYPLIPENMANSAIYNDNWLSHQEVILTQLINGLFENTGRNTTSDDPAILRHELLMVYREAPFTNLYRRIQASLMYGALTIPKDILTKNSRIRQDLGMKRKFIDFWLQTYNLRALRAAAETVTGRRIPEAKAPSHSVAHSTIEDTALDQSRGMKKRIARFLDTFLVQNKDMERHENEPRAQDPEALDNIYHRTVLRSMMMIILLDKARMCPSIELSGPLFLDSSPYKSSLEVLRGLSGILLPSCGDISRALGQLDCQVSYKQHPLEEYDYNISNLAIDLRDGIVLTRIVELLLYPSASPLCEVCPSISNSIVALSASALEECRWPLSQNLKFPCVSRTVKLFNAKIALDALASTDARQLINDVRPEDIVDGHREKTMALLWGLVCQWGISGLVDLDDLKKEISQMRKSVVSQFGSESKEVVDDYVQRDDPALLLKRWASLVAQARGLDPDTVATSFGDGKIYECIVDEYEGYIVQPSQNVLSDGSKAPLEDRLRALGCSIQFVHLVSPGISKAHILDTDFTVGALAFLCSRLLSATKRVRAARVLQNAWRRVLQRRELQKRRVAREIAIQCAAVVQTRNRILWAKRVIMQWWRMVKKATPERQRTKIIMTHGRKSTKLPLRCYR